MRMLLQYRMEETKDKIFLFKAGALVNFAMDLEQVIWQLNLKKKRLFSCLLIWEGEGVNAGAGNPIFEDKYSVFYMWEDVLTKDSILEIISKFMFIEVKEKEDESTGKKR